MHSLIQRTEYQNFTNWRDIFMNYENKFHKLSPIGGILIDLMKIIAQYEKKNYMVCDGRSAL